MEHTLKEQIDKIIDDTYLNKNLAVIFEDFYDDMDRKGLIQGGCHFLSSILHVILNEFDIDNELCLGNVEMKGCIFSHSWIDIKGKVFDIAIMKTNRSEISLNGVVFSGVDLSTGNLPEINYGVYSDQDLVDSTGKQVKKLTLGEYFGNNPYGSQFVWNYIADFCKMKKKFVNTRRLKEKYADEKWVRK